MGAEQPRAAESGAYHHGDLPETLMSLALTHIEETGTEKLSLRALAREAGVSPTAPYRHFPSKRCLLAALATKGFRQLREHMSAIPEDLDSRERFVAMGLAYLDFAKHNPTTYHLMFGAVIGDFSSYDMLKDASHASFDYLKEQLQHMIDENNLPYDAVTLSGVVWSGVHGMASLMANVSAERRDDSPPGRAIRSLHEDPERSLRIMFDGLMASSAH